MKLAVLVLLAVAVCPQLAGATDYYVSTSGSDTNAGTAANPFATIQAAANVAQAGDRVLIRGGTYRESVTVQHSGTAAAPISFQACAGELVTITGLDPVSTTWTSYSGPIYQTDISTPVSQVFVDGKAMNQARWPNPVYNNPLDANMATVKAASVHAAPATTTITDSAITAPSGTWTGAKVAVTSGSQWVTSSAAVTGQSGSTLSIQWTGSTSSSYSPKAGNPYYLYGTVAAVDAQKEWYHDSTAGKLYFVAPGGGSPATQNVEIRTRDVGLDIGNQSYVTVSGVRFQAATVKAAGDHNTITNCQILYPSAPTDPGGWASPAGVTFSGQYNTLSNSEIAYSYGDGVTLQNSHNTVQNNVIHDVDWSGTDGAFVKTSGASDNTIMHNTMYNAGRSGVLHRGATQNTTITHNDISRYGKLTKDLGGTYTWGSTGEGTEIAYNVVHDADSPGLADGIYLDNYNSGTTVHHNVVYNVATGIRLNTPASDDVIANNTLWGVSAAMATYAVDGGTMTGCQTYNNLANQGTWLGNSKGNNLSTTTSPFVSAAAGNFQLRDGVAAIDYGRVIAGITEGYTGAAPDAGAFERGVAPWTAGASFTSWLAPNQTRASLAAALYVKPDGTRVTTGDLVAGNPNSTAGSDNRAFLVFDLSDAPQGRKLLAATLRLYQADGTGSTYGSVKLHEVLSQWTAATVAYNQSVGSGMSFGYDAANLDFYQDIDITAIVQAWLVDPSSNRGLSLRGTEGFSLTAKYFGGAYDVTPPELVLTWESVPVPEPASAVLLLIGGLSVLCRSPGHLLMSGR